MLGIISEKFFAGQWLEPHSFAWERCCPNTTAVIYFWMKRVGSFGQIKKIKQDGRLAPAYFSPEYK